MGRLNSTFLGILGIGAFSIILTLWGFGKCRINTGLCSSCSGKRSEGHHFPFLRLTEHFVEGLVHTAPLAQNPLLDGMGVIKFVELISLFLSKKEHIRVSWEERKASHIFTQNTEKILTYLLGQSLC